MELAHNKDLGVFSLSDVQWCQSTAAYAKSNSRASDTPGSGAAASYLCCQIPQLCFSRSCSCLQLAVMPASCQWRWQHFPQPFPHHLHPEKLKLTLSCCFMCVRIVMQAYLVLVWCVCGLDTGTVKANTYCRQEKRYYIHVAKASHWDEIMWSMTNLHMFCISWQRTERCQLYLLRPIVVVVCLIK